MFCVHCGAECREGDKFCVRCGKSLIETGFKQERQVEEVGNKKAKYGLFIGIVCFLIVAVVAIVVITLSFGKAMELKELKTEYETQEDFESAEEEYDDVENEPNKDTGEVDDVQSLDESQENISTTDANFDDKEKNIDESDVPEIVSENIEEDDSNTSLERIYISKISATSELNAHSKDGSTYIPENMVDGDINTAWLEGTDGVGIGELISIEFDEEKDVSEIDIYPGFQKTKYRYLINGQPTKMLIEWENGQEEINLDRIIVSNEEEAFEMDENPISQFIPGEKIRTKYLKFTIIDAVSGSKYSDTAISEIMVYEKNTK